MSSPLLIPVGYQFFDNAGKPLSGGSLSTFAANTTTPQATYSDDALSVLNPNPIPLDSAGRCTSSSLPSGVEINVYPIAASYKLVLADSSGTTIWTHDQVDPAAPFNVLTAATIVSPIITTPTITSPTINTSIISASALLNWVCQGRLTLTSGSPVTASDVTGATTIFFTPYGGRNIALYDGFTSWTLLPFVETSLSLGTLTSGLPYDVFGFNNSGVLGLELLAWSTGTARATALVLQDGVLTKTGALTRRYLGTFYTTSTTQTEDSYAKRYVWNYYNRVRRPLRTALETTDSWQYTLNTYRQANANAANQLNLVVGVAEVALEATAYSIVANSGPNPAWTSIGENSTSAPATGVLMLPSAIFTAGGLYVNMASLVTIPAIGVNFYAWLEKSTAAGTTTWYGDNGTATQWQAGITGWSEG